MPTANAPAIKYHTQYCTRSPPSLHPTFRAPFLNELASVLFSAGFDVAPWDLLTQDVVGVRIRVLLRLAHAPVAVIVPLYKQSIDDPLNWVHLGGRNDNDAFSV